MSGIEFTPINEVDIADHVSDIQHLSNDDNNSTGFSSHEEQNVNSEEYMIDDDDETNNANGIENEAFQVCYQKFI